MTPTTQPKAEDKHAKTFQALVEFYDNHIGTPCEQIRHKQEIENLQSQVNKLRDALEAIKRAQEQKDYWDAGFTRNEAWQIAHQALADTAPMEQK